MTRMTMARRDGACSIAIGAGVWFLPKRKYRFRVDQD
jgi:hypothetical protein